MQYQVFTQSRPEQKFVASIVGIPDLVGEGNTKNEAIALAKIALRQQLTTGELVAINVDEPSTQSDLWVENLGIFADEPTFEDFLAEVAGYRQQVDAQT